MIKLTEKIYNFRIAQKSSSLFFFNKISNSLKYSLKLTNMILVYI